MKVSCRRQLGAFPALPVRQLVCRPRSYNRRWHLQITRGHIQEVGRLLPVVIFSQLAYHMLGTTPELSQPQLTRLMIPQVHHPILVTPATYEFLAALSCRLPERM